MSYVARHVENVIRRLASSHCQVSTGRVYIIINPQSKHPERLSLLCADHDLSKVLFSMGVVLFKFHFNHMRSKYMVMGQMDFFLPHCCRIEEVMRCIVCGVDDLRR